MERKSPIIIAFSPKRPLSTFGPPRPQSAHCPENIQRRPQQSLQRRSQTAYRSLPSHWFKGCSNMAIQRIPRSRDRPRTGSTCLSALSARFPDLHSAQVFIMTHHILRLQGSATIFQGSILEWLVPRVTASHIWVNLWMIDSLVWFSPINIYFTVTLCNSLTYSNQSNSKPSPVPVQYCRTRAA